MDATSRLRARTLFTAVDTMDVAPLDSLFAAERMRCFRQRPAGHGPVRHDFPYRRRGEDRRLPRARRCGAHL
jgi:hypothetical protein